MARKLPSRPHGRPASSAGARRGAGILLACLLIPALLAGGCTTSHATQGRPGAAAADGPGKRAGTSEDASFATDPCASRLQNDMAGPLLLYYAVKRRLPEKLDDIRQFADADQTLNFTCPVSGQPYVYDPAGLKDPGQERWLIVYDPTPAHGGTRWGIVFAPPSGNQPATLYTVHLLEPVFQKYTRATPHAG